MQFTNRSGVNIQTLNNMKISIYLLSVMILAGLIQSCQTEQTALLPNPTGKPGEVLLVIDKYLWESELGNHFNEIMSQPFEVLPQYEPKYSLVNIPSSALNNLFKTHRNIIITKVSQQYKEPSIIVQKNTWAKHQLLVNVAGPSETEVLNYLKENSGKLINLLDQAERDRNVENYRKNRAKGIDAQLQQNHHLSISVPAGYALDEDTTNFIWLSHEIADLIQGVLIYYYDYTDPNTFTPEFLMDKRNEITRKFVNGPTDNSYMIIEDLVPMKVTEMLRDSLYTVELRGLWKLENAFMGGPFISFTMLDEKRNRVVTVDGFVHAPSLNKRNYIRELEAILYTFDIID